MTRSEQHVFLRFMQKHKAWNKFKKQVKKDHVKLSLSQYFERVSIYDAISCGFFFDRSLQGGNYWYNLNEKLQKIADHG